MPSKSFAKVQKSISKKRGSKPTALHEHSRDAKRIKRAAERDSKIAKLKSAHSRATHSHLQRVAYFQELVKSSNVKSYDSDDAVALVNEFIRRNDERITEVKAARRTGRPPSKDETDLTQVKEAESQELVTGFWIPDLRDVENVERLGDWNGDWVALGQIKFARVDGEGKMKDSRWPPNR